ncbi:hypothetical protein ACHMW6_06190 [Pseudoduganella sp. UC29_106]|uniref:hypothetical protein n=1 Tax=Pseudoduganella sp. UC29_106 TaxID=3374553 RepID=UPI0037575D5C
MHTHSNAGVVTPADSITHPEVRMVVGTLSDPLIGNHHCIRIEGDTNAQALTGFVGAPDDTQSRATARRLADCWNACNGLTQDHFDGGWTAKGLSRHASAMEDRLAMAIALLKRTEEYSTTHSITGQSIRKFLAGGEV